MMELACDAIVARLKLKFGADWKVETFPDAPERYAFAAKTETLLVAYERSAYQPPNSMRPMSQQRDAEFGVTLLVRSLRGAKGAQLTIDNVRRYLFGWRPTKANEDDVQVPIGLGPLIPLRDELVGEDNGVWRFVVVFSGRAFVVEDAEALTGPPLTSISSP